MPASNPESLLVLTLKYPPSLYILNLSKYKSSEIFNPQLLTSSKLTIISYQPYRVAREFKSRIDGFIEKTAREFAEDVSRRFRNRTVSKIVYKVFYYFMGILWSTAISIVISLTISFILAYLLAYNVLASVQL